MMMDMYEDLEIFWFADCKIVISFLKK
jgi:hypothetical protein